MENHLCDYGCGKEGIYKIGKKWCCSKSFNSCESKKYRRIVRVYKENSEMCENGCGNKAVYQLKNKKWICNKDHRKCPINKLKYGQPGDRNPMYGKIFSNDHRRKIGLKSKEKKGKYKPETIELYKKIRAGKGNPRYGKPFKHKPEDLVKLRKTMEEHGYWYKLEDLSKFRLYRREVEKYTNISISKKFTSEQLKNRGRLKEKHIHIDHIFSVVEGFKLNIDPKIIGCKSNIRILSVHENCSKQTKCGISKEELFKKYEVEIKDENVECSS